jgi:tetratricopeptide (TPR) repeat protein
MGKRGNADARRARKKQLKAQRRKKVVAAKKLVYAAREALWFDSADSADSFGADDPFELEGSLEGDEPWHSPWDPWVDGLEGLVSKRGLHPLEAAVHADYFMDMGFGDTGGSEEKPALWTRKAVASLATDDILARLDALGIYTNEAAFNEVASRSSSAWQLSREEWLPRLTVASDVHLRDFLGLTAHELWKRFRPDALSSEMVLEPFFERGYASDERRVMELDLAFWERLKRLLTPDIRTAKHVDALLAKGESGHRSDNDDQRFSDWSMDIACFASDEPAALAPELSGRVAAMLAEILDRLTDDRPWWRRALNESRASLLIAAGDREQAERILLDIIEQHPEHASAYFRLADLWTSRGASDPTAFKRAITLLKRWTTSASHAVDSDRVELLIKRLEETLSRIEGSPSAGELRPLQP